MILTLEVMGEQAAQLGAGRRKVFNAIGGTIGRLPDNDWVLPDPYVSGRHALIRYLNGDISLDEASEGGKRDTRHYTKRQATWFRNQLPDFTWLTPDAAMHEAQAALRRAPS